MLATLAIATALSLAPNQESGLKLSNPHFTYGVLGNLRKSNKFLPADAAFLAYDIEGLSVAKDGRIKYSMELTVKNAAGEKLTSRFPELRESANSLGGRSVPALAVLEIGGDQPAGKYTVTVIVKDEATGKSKALTQDFEVLKKQFGIGRAGLFYEDQKTPAPPLFVVGQSAWVHFVTFHFDRDPRDKAPNLQVKLQIFDEKGKPTLPEAVKGDTKAMKLTEKVQGLPWWQKLELNRAGKFRIELEATDAISKKTVKEQLNITVMEMK